MKRFICVHGHFYQPPRENPWLEEIELQDSAFPYHDWNERITIECYEPNRAARILDAQEQIIKIVNNYARISFNFGPTLLSWLERHRPETYEAILSADRRSQERFSGHGAALAQAYGHLIMPLANPRDKRTQILWGIRDFTRRFQRQPAGIWLPETAVDLETLELLAEQEIRFTLLAPHQAARVRRKNSKERWTDVSGGRIDPKMPYLCQLPSGRSIALFFYDGPIAREVAFAGLLNNGGDFVRRMGESFSGKATSELVHIATDGETYGHHHAFGEMALAYGLDQIDGGDQFSLTIYGEYLEKNPPTHEVRILENTSWSCAHGIERWRADCGCRIGVDGGANQAWRAPLREALNWLRDTLAPHYEQHLGALCNDPWGARDTYIDVVLDRSPEQRQAFFQQHSTRPLTEVETNQALRLLELQRHAMLMFTSCGWFFDEVSGIETVQILAYAARVLQLAKEACDLDLEGEFLTRLEQVPSNLHQWGNAAHIYREQVRPMQLDLLRVAAHHAIVSQFEEPELTTSLYCYRAEDLERQQVHGGRMQLTMGQTLIRSEITRSQAKFCFAVLHLGGHHLNAGVRPYIDVGDFTDLASALREAFEQSDLSQLIRMMDQQFGGRTFSLGHLFKDEQRRIVNQIMKQTLGDIFGEFTTLYEDNYTLLRFLRNIHMPIPQPLSMPAEQVINQRLRNILVNGPLDAARFRSLLEEAHQLHLPLDKTLLCLAAADRVNRQMEQLASAPGELTWLANTIETIATVQALPWPFDLWQAQNRYIEIYQRLGSAMNAAMSSGDSHAIDWMKQFRRLGGHLKVNVA